MRYSVNSESPTNHQQSQTTSISQAEGQVNHEGHQVCRWAALVSTAGSRRLVQQIANMVVKRLSADRQLILPHAQP